MVVVWWWYGGQDGGGLEDDGVVRGTNQNGIVLPGMCQGPTKKTFSRINPQPQNYEHPNITASSGPSDLRARAPL